MGAARQGFDLTNKYGRKHFFTAMLGRKVCRMFGWYCPPLRHAAMKYVWGDTFGRIRCMITGHDIYGQPGDYACRKCHKFLPTPSEEK